MDAEQQTPEPDGAAKSGMSPWRITGWIAAGVIAVSVISCVIMAAVRSDGLVEVTVTALDAAAEPRDHNLPLIKQKEALPDYEIIVIRNNGERIGLGAKPDTSAVDGISWKLSDPVSLADIASVRLQEQDKVISDALAEVHLTGDSVIENGYRFDFTSERSVSVGVQSFFGTPIGKAITAGFFIAVLLIVLSFIDF